MDNDNIEARKRKEAILNSLLEYPSATSKSHNDGKEQFVENVHDYIPQGSIHILVYNF